MRLDRCILVGLLSVLPVAFWPGSTSYEAAKFLVIALAAGGFFCAAAWKVWRRQQIVLPALSLAICAMVVLLLIVVSSLAGGGVWLSLRTAVLVAAAGLVSWFAYSCIRTESHFIFLMRGLVAGGCVTSLYGLAQMGGILSGPDPTLGVPVGISTYGNENQMSGYAALVMWPAVALAVSARSTVERFVVGFASVVLLAAVVIADASGPRVAVCVALFAVSSGWVLVRLKAFTFVPRYLQALVAVGVISAVFLFFRILEPQVWPDLSLPDVVSRLLAANSGDVRRTDWLVAWHQFQSSGFWGVGVGSYQVHWIEARAALTDQGMYENLAVYTPVATRAHNDYLQLIAEAGLAGLLVLGAGLVVLMRELKRNWCRVADERMALIWLVMSGAVVTGAVHALVSFPFHLPAPSFVVAGIVGVLAAPVFSTSAKEARPSLLLRQWAWLPAIIGLLIAGLGVREFSADLMTARGENDYAAGRFSEAAVALEGGVEKALWTEHGDLYLGLALAALEESETAEKYFTASMQHHPSFEALLALAEIETDRQNYSRALARLDLVDGCEPTESFRRRSRYLRSMVRLRQGDFASARLGFVKLIQEEPRDYRTLLALGYLAVLEEKEPEARAHYRRALDVIDEELTVVVEPGERARLEKIRVVAVRAVGSVW